MKFLLLLSILLALVVCFQATEARVRSPTTSLTFTPSIQYTKLMMLQKSSRHYHYTYSKTTGIISIHIKLIWLGTTDRIKYAYCSSQRKRTKSVDSHKIYTNRNTFIHGEGGLMHTDSVYRHRHGIQGVGVGYNLCQEPSACTHPAHLHQASALIHLMIMWIKHQISPRDPCCAINCQTKRS